MIGYVPTPVKGELIYSLVARWRHEIGGTASKAIDAWFGGACVDVPVAMPRVGLMVSRLPPRSGLTPEVLLGDHTLFNFCAGFYDAATWREAQAHMLSTTGDGPRQGSWLAPHVTADRMLRFCPECASLDIAEVGSATWRREHQLRGAYVCARHGSPLLGDPAFQDGSAPALTVPPEDLTGHELRVPYAIATARQLASWLEEACRDRRPIPDGAEPARMRRLLGERGYISRDKTVDLDALRRDLEDHYGLSAFDDFRSRKVGAKPFGWLPRVTTGEGLRFQPPLGVTMILCMLDVPWPEYDAPLETKWFHEAPRRPESARRIGTLRDVAVHKDLILEHLATPNQLKAGKSKLGFARAMRFVKAVDPVWYAAHVPSGDRTLPRLPKDIRQSDELALARLERKIERELQGNGPPKRMSREWLLAAAGLQSVAHRAGLLEDFPLTMTRIQAMTEDPGAARRRRLSWVVRTASAAATLPGWDKFLRLAYRSGTVSEQDIGAAKVAYAEVQERRERQKSGNGHRGRPHVAS